MKLKEVAHARTGDKGDISNISLIPYKEEDYEFLKRKVTAERVKEYFSEIRSLALDKHGKTLGMALLEMEV